jgi:HEAT repeat protein
MAKMTSQNDANERAAAMYALSQAAGPRSADEFRKALGDADERVRAYAAQGLVRIGDTGALAACLKTLNDAADELHLDMTPSVQALGEMGLKAAPALLELLLHDDEMTRLHAQRALELILSRRHGFRPGRGFPSRAAEEAMRAEWRANGDYDYSAEPEARARAMERWREWLARTKE